PEEFRSEPAGDPRRPRAARASFPESREKRLSGDERPGRPHRHHAHRDGLPYPRAGARAREIHPGRHRGQRARHQGRRPAAYLLTVLLDEERRHGARPRDLLPHHQRARRADPRREPRGRLLQSIPARRVNPMNQGKVLVVEDDKSVLAVLRGLLEEDGYWVRAVETGQRGRAELEENDFDVCLVDINLPDMDGLDLLREVKENGSTASVIIMTARNTMNNAIDAMKNGAFEYITKPFENEEISMQVKRALESRKLVQDFQQLKKEVRKSYEPGNMVGTSPAMQKVYKIIGQVANTEASILIQGESGTGKELVAKTIHYNSPRWD